MAQEHETNTGTTTPTKVLTFSGLSKYDELIKAKIDADVASVDAKITNIINGTDSAKVKNAEYATAAGSATTAETAGSATTATTAEKLGSDKVGDADTPIYLNDGVATEITSVAVTKGGTGATDAAGARTNLGVYSSGDTDAAIEAAISGIRTKVNNFFANDAKVEGLVDTLVEIQKVLDNDEEVSGTVKILTDIADLQEKVGDGFVAITNTEIEGLFTSTTQNNSEPV